MSTNYKSSQRKCNIYFVAKTQSATILANCLSHLYAITLLNAVYRRREQTHIYALTHSRLRVSNNSRVLRLHNFCALTHMPRGDERAQFTIIVYVHKCSARIHHQIGLAGRIYIFGVAPPKPMYNIQPTELISHKDIKSADFARRTRGNQMYKHTRPDNKCPRKCRRSLVRQADPVDSAAHLVV